MSNSLTGYTPGETYGSLLTVSNFNDGVDATLRTVYDGKGDASALRISTTDVDIAGTFRLNGVALTATAAELNTISTFGTMSLQNANSVTITGGSITGITDIAVADGGTGASTATSARSNLGLVIGTDVQAHTSTLDAVSAGTYTGASSITTLGTITTGVWTGTNIAVANGGTGAATASSARTNLGLVIGTDVQAYDADLAAVAGLSSTGIITRTASGTAATRTLTGTSNQVTVTNGNGVSGNPTLSLPQDIHTTASPVFTAVQVGNGTAASPSLTFSADADTGLYRSSTNQVGIAGAGGLIVDCIGVASGVNYAQFTNSALGSNPTMSWVGADSAVNGYYRVKGAASHIFETRTNVTQFRVVDTASAVNYATATGSTTTNGVSFAAAGSDTDISVNITPKGAGVVRANTGLFVNPGSSTYDTLTSVHAIKASTDVQYCGERTSTSADKMYWGGGGNGFTVYSSTPMMVMRVSTAGDVSLCANQGAESLRAVRVSSAVNRLNITGATTGNSVAIDAAGSDTNIALAINAKGSGSITSSSPWNVTTTQTTSNGFAISGTAQTTGSTLSLSDNSSSTSTRAVANIISDHASASGCRGIALQQDSTADAIFIDKNNNGAAINIDADDNSASAMYGMIIDIVNAGAGLEYAFRFNGEEIVSSAVGGSQNKKIRVSIAGTDYFIPLHTA